MFTFIPYKSGVLKEVFTSKETCQIGIKFKMLRESSFTYTHTQTLHIVIPPQFHCYFSLYLGRLCLPSISHLGRLTDGDSTNKRFYSHMLTTVQSSIATAST